MKSLPRLAALAACVSSLALGLPGAAMSAQSRALTIALTGAAEGPGLGDPDGSGTAELRIDPDQGQFCYALKVADIAPARLAHIHQSPVGEAGGPIVVTLEAPTDGDSEGCVAIDPALARSLLQNGAAYYVNVHNPEHPGGAVRGQLG
jgi:hypothetical protein